MDGRLAAARPAPPRTWREHVEARAWAYKAAAGAGLWVSALYISGPHLGVLFICVSALLFFFCAHRLGGRSKGAGGYAFLNARGQQAAGELSSQELDAHMRGLPPPAAAAAAAAVQGSGWQGAEAGGGGGKALGSGAVPSANALLAELAQQRARRRAAAAAAAGGADAGAGATAPPP